MSRLQEAARLLEERKAAAFGARSTGEIPDGAMGANRELTLILSGEDVNVHDLQDYGRMGVASMLNALAPLQTEEDVLWVMQSLWIEGVLLGISLGRVPHG